MSELQESMQVKTPGIHSLLKTAGARRSSIIPFVGLLFIAVFFQIVSHGRLLSARNAPILINQVYTTMLGCSALVFVITQGNLDFSMGAVAGTCAAVAAQAIKVSPWLVLPVAIATGVIIGCVNGFVNAKLNVPSFIATLAMSFMLSGLTLQILGDGSLGIPISMLKFDNIWLKVAALVVLVGLGFLLFEFTPFGKRSRAIGACTEAARQSGVNIRKAKIQSFLLTGGMAGFIGLCALIRSGTASASTGSSLMFDALNALMLGGLPLAGGAGSRYRAVLVGSLAMAILSNGMTLWGLGVIPQQLVRGLIFLAAIYLSFDRKNVTIIK